MMFTVKGEGDLDSNKAIFTLEKLVELYNELHVPTSQMFASKYWHLMEEGAI